MDCGCGTVRVLAMWVLVLFLVAAGGVAHGAEADKRVRSTPFPTFTQGDAAAPADLGTGEEMQIGLADAVFLALRHNRTIKSAYLNRVVQKYSLELSRHEFKPDLDVSASSSRTVSKTRTYGTDGTATSETKTKSDSTSIAPSVTQKVPTGGQFGFTWTHSPSESVTRTDDSYSHSEGQSNTWAVEFSQPLLAGAGYDYDMVSLRKAENTEKTNILSLKSTLISTVTSAITAYRSFLQASRQIDISKASLERTRRLYEVNKELIAAGRMAAMDIVQTEADLASREVAYENALNSLDQARLSLLQVLDLDRDTQLVPAEDITIVPIKPDLDVCLEAAFEHSPNWQRDKISLDNAEMDVLVAERDLLPSLNLTSGYSYTDSRNRAAADSLSDSWNAGLSLSVPLYGDGALSKRNTHASAKTALRVAKLQSQELRESLEIEVLNAVRDVRSKLKQVRLATRARELSERKLNVEREKLHLGLTSNFQLVTYQNDLVQAQESEVSAQIAYLNALTNLDQTLGTTLNTWKIEFRDERPELERKALED